jgi:hypothetical protein
MKRTVCGQVVKMMTKKKRVIQNWRGKLRK